MNIEDLRNEIAQLCADLGKSLTDFPILQIQKDNFNQNVLRQHELLRDELSKQWKEVTNGFDDLLSDLDKSSADSPSDEQMSSLDATLEDISDQDLFRWMDHGKKFNLLNDKQRKEIRQKAQQKHQQFVEKFNQFKKERKADLAKQKSTKHDKTKMINKTRKGYAWLFRFSN